MRYELITVVIPAYNSEKYINKCIDSVLSQTYKNLEIIVVNDGSTDNTASVVKTYKDVVLLNKIKGGSSSARNYGIKHVNGKYVIFLDSDDYLNTDFISTLYGKTSGRIDELIVCDLAINNKPVGNTEQELIIEGRSSIYDMFLQSKIYNSSVNKLYPIEMIKKASFPEGRDMLEDAYFTSHVLENCNRVIIIPYAGYNYVRHDDSLSKKKHNRVGIAGKYSNLLEKDIMLTKYIPKNEYAFAIKLIAEHIKNTFFSVKDISLFDIPNKIMYLVSFMFENKEHIEDKKIEELTNYLHIASTTKQLKKQFMMFIMFKSLFREKYIFMKSTIRKIIKKH